ncbi:receptor-type tyrosine-protein phosphatase U isoform X5 [Salmo salar]|uniref:Receptor-type tyrosine-protein phosphatase U n=1 Tax=Salmo salar TaxID=8030 RepID=A0A1S3M4E7_SALSA|nr:receptor-type tyrosine-protein phosphatase U-like isoform X5 [Salmo salar]|eukprot:XP_013997856.1 PREDICTED: receptor-type tyrosine-protein phosphatase U-like isoform X5 [Salmo salar]
MYTGVFLLMLLVGIYADTMDQGPTAGCTFDEDSDPGLCEYKQGQEDDFDWQLMRTYNWPHSTPDLLRGSFMMVNSSQHAAGQRAHLLLRSLSENDTHCIQFSYFLYSRDGHSPGDLQLYIRVNGGPRGSAVWNVSGSHGRQWHQVELAVSTFWPSEYQVVFEASVSAERRGYIAIDDILLLNYPCYKVPHFSRLGDVEVNAGQNATFQCVATGKTTETEPFLLERRNGVVVAASSIQRLSHKRLMATFQVAAERGEQDLYRCVTESTRGAAVSNFAELIVRVPPTPIAPPQLLRAGPTYLIIQLNTNSIVGDGPVIRREIEYRASQSPWSETHGVGSLTYKVWHLEPDTEYRISVLLTRPGEGGTGAPGPPLVSRTKCAEPMRALRGLTATEIQPRQLTLQWEPMGYNLTRCHTYSVSLCYRYSTPAGGSAGNNATVRECLSVERNQSHFTLRDLPPFRSVHVRLALENPEGKKESREVTFQTEEDIPGGVAPESLTFTPLDDMIFLKWEEPVEPNGVITQYEISYQGIESSDPGINVPGPRRTVSKLRNETYHMFSGLHPGTTYLVSVRARTAKGFGQTALTEITTNISAPVFDYEDVPAPLSESESTITVLLRPALGRGAPVSAYQVVVVEEDGSRRVRRSRRRRRELGSGSDCFPVPASQVEAQSKSHYYTAELPPSSLPEATPFTVGDNHTYNGYWNTPLDPSKNYLVFFQAISNFRGETRMNCIRIARKGACKDHKRTLEVSQHAEDMGLILGACAGGLVVLILLLGAIVIVVKKGRKKVALNKAAMSYRQEKTRKLGSLDCSMTEQSTLQQDERTANSFMDAHACNTRNEQRSSVNESSSLLGGSPRRHCRRKSSPYHTGQLHPAVRVADLLQHINQMKTGEGYGFKQEYESFFDGWDVTKKKDKTKGRHDSLLGHDRHRVKLHSLLADPNSDYVNANYIDIRINREGYQRSNHFIATQGPKQEMIYDFWRMVWQENCFSIVMITKLVEVGRMKCCKYWPEDSELYGDIKITLLKTETLAEYTVRTFAMERRGYPAKHEVCQFHFTSWPEHGVPYHATGLLAFLRRVKASTPPDAGPVVVHCSMGAGRTGCYIVLDVMLDMAECEGVVDIYNCVKTLCSRRINMIQTEEQYVFIHDAILEACLCGETAIPVIEFALTYKEMLRVDSQSNTSQLREEFQTLNSVTPHLDVEECSVSLLPRNREKNRSMDVLPPDRALAFLVTTEGVAEGNSYINAALTDSFHRPAAFVVTPHPLPGTTADFWRLVYDYGCTSVVMLNQINQSNSAWVRRGEPCLQYWPEPGLQQFGPMTVELLSMMADDDVIIRLFRVQNIMRDPTDLTNQNCPATGTGTGREDDAQFPSKLQEGQLVVRHFQFLRWSPYRDVPDSKKAFLSLLAQVHNWQRECGEGRTIVHCLNGGGRSGTFCACTMLLEMIRHHSVVDVFYAAKTLRNSKPNMVETMEQYRFCYDLALEYLDALDCLSEIEVR